MDEYEEYSDGDIVEGEDEEDFDEEYSSDEINRKAIALFDFVPENDNEVALREGQLIWISYRHGQGWLVAEDPETGENGLVPEGYVEIWNEEEEEEEEVEQDGEENAGQIEVSDVRVPVGSNNSRNENFQHSGERGGDDDEPKRFLPEILHYEEGEWVDTEDETEEVYHRPTGDDS
ncbi:hypothetical protein CLIB1423_01S05842 [[Candida] railenensis]|uniref:SH3 domain-containing protein n=1 Tax=[Candida] railenensis TaxID=45579 RepID=A0A9P0VWA4_9ASCO|nr:hypothetical protein CLIB1423_01S05842 [[Candida] railenensis]